MSMPGSQWLAVPQYRTGIDTESQVFTPNVCQTQNASTFSGCVNYYTTVSLSL